MEGGNVTTSSADMSLAGHRVLISCDLRCPVSRIPRETLFDERVDIDAKIDPTITHDHCVRYPSMHLISYDTLSLVTEHQSSPCIMLISDMQLNTKGFAIGHIDLKNEELVHNIQARCDLNLFGSGTSHGVIIIASMRRVWR